MKTLILPLSILLISAASCCKQDMPVPASATDVAVTRSNARLSGDTLVRITLHPSERGPIFNEKPQVIKP